MALISYPRVRQIVGSSLGADIVTYNLEKAVQESRDRALTPQSTFYDPTDIFMGREWAVRKGHPLGFPDLRAMAKNPIVGSIIQTRINQVAAFCVPQQSYYSHGFIIEPINESVKRDEKRISDIRDFVATCGTIGFGEATLETFVRKFLRDSLILDQATAEIVQARNGKQPAYFVAVDAATIRLLRKALDFASLPGREPLYVQVVDDIIQTQYRWDQMIFGTRNPTTEIAAAGYGFSELETLIRTVTLILNAEKYNSGLLGQGGTQKGILVVRGEMAAQPQEFDAFKRDFREAIRNAADFWRPPILRVPKDGQVDWVALDRSNRDMEYAALFDFLVKQACGVYQMHPDEINWTIGATGAKVNFESNSNGKLTYSQEKGLKPLLVFLANQLNEKIVTRLDPNYRLRFVGMESDRESDSTVNMREVQNYKTINEVRKGLGLPPLPGGDVIMNNAYISMLFPDVPTPRDATPQERDVNIDPANDTSRSRLLQ